MNVQTLSSSFSAELVQDHLPIDRAWFSEFTDEYTREVRLRHVRGKLCLNEQWDREKCILLYQEWVRDDNYLVLKKTDPREGISYEVHKARKRGNDVDAWHLGRRLGSLRDAVFEYTHQGARLRSTNAVYITGTVDPRLVEGDAEYAWQYLGYWFNMFLTRLRKKCITIDFDKDGKIVPAPAKIRVLRSWEAHESGWPHFHAILCFEGFPWEIFQDSNSRWRIEDKAAFEDAWPYGWVDVLALTPGTVEKNLENVVWYVAKNLSDMDYRLVDSWPIKRLLTQSTLWYYGKRSFSISRDCRNEDGSPKDCGHGWCETLREARADLKKRSSITQTDLEGNLLPELPIIWEFVGLVRRKNTELSREDWAKIYSDPPDWLSCCWNPHHSKGGLGWTDSWGR